MKLTTIISTTSILLILNHLAFNAQASSIADAVLQCKAEENSLKRLLCFDKIADQIETYDDQSFEDIEQLPPSANLDSPSREQSSEDDFGKERSPQTDSLSGVVTAVENDRSRRQIISLSNGQVWREVEASSTLIRPGQSVTIERGMFGAFFLNIDGSNRQTRVVREN